MSEPVAYKPFARYLHWIMAVLILSTFPVGVTMIQQGLSRPVQDALFIYHKNVGVLILVLVLVRLIYRVFNPAPPLPDSVPAWQRSVAKATHWLLYLLIVVMTVSGLVRIQAGGFPIEYWDAAGLPQFIGRDKEIEEAAKAIHYTARFALFALIVAHVGAALMHLLVKRDGVFQRMWPRRA